MANSNAGGMVGERSEESARGHIAIALLAGFALYVIGVLNAYRVGYADGARQAAPLAAPPTQTERAR